MRAIAILLLLLGTAHAGEVVVLDRDRNLGQVLGLDATSVYYTLDIGYGGDWPRTDVRAVPRDGGAPRPAKLAEGAIVRSDGIFWPTDDGVRWRQPDGKEVLLPLPGEKTRYCFAVDAQAVYRCTVEELPAPPRPASLQEQLTIVGAVRPKRYRIVRLPRQQPTPQVVAEVDTEPHNLTVDGEALVWAAPVSDTLAADDRLQRFAGGKLSTLATLAGHAGGIVVHSGGIFVRVDRPFQARRDAKLFHFDRRRLRALPLDPGVKEIGVLAVDGSWLWLAGGKLLRLSLADLARGQQRWAEPFPDRKKVSSIAVADGDLYAVSDGSLLRFRR